MVFEEGSTNAPSHIKINDMDLNIEEMKWSVVGTTSEAMKMSPDLPDEDGKTTKGNEASDEDPINQCSRGGGRGECECSCETARDRGRCQGSGCQGSHVG